MKKNKKIIFLIVILAILILITILLMNIFNISIMSNNMDKNNENVVKINQNASINEVKILEGLSFESTKIVYSNGMSTLTTKVTNNYSEIYNKTTFNIIIKGKDNEEIITIPGIISGGLNPNESKLIVSVVDVDLSSNAYYIEYEEVE